MILKDFRAVSTEIFVEFTAVSVEECFKTIFRLLRAIQCVRLEDTIQQDLFSYVALILNCVKEKFQSIKH